MRADDWHCVINTNLTGAFLCAQQVLQPMMKARWGRIINISSVVGEMGNAGAGKLFGFESRIDRLDEIACAGDGRAGNYRECRGSRLCADRYDGHLSAKK